MFPAGAGMNRVIFYADWLWLRVPRRRGDEPQTMDEVLPEVMCSPQARG